MDELRLVRSMRTVRLLNDPLHAHTSAACILGDKLLIAALQHYVRGEIRKTETGEPAALEETYVDKRDSRSPARDGGRALRKRRASRSPDRRPRDRGSRSRSSRRARPRDRSYRGHRSRSRSRNRSPSPRREYRANSPRRTKSDSHQESKR